ncbi:hypothetical protein BDZ97DRAFT_1754973 [Flammula alnicola]|nr:hypothetical protein BDZ97DRAFT_1754973 [Flammula alnicola]
MDNNYNRFTSSREILPSSAGPTYMKLPNLAPAPLRIRDPPTSKTMIAIDNDGLPESQTAEQPASNSQGALPGPTSSASRQASLQNIFQIGSSGGAINKGSSGNGEQGSSQDKSPSATSPSEIDSRSIIRDDREKATALKVKYDSRKIRNTDIEVSWFASTSGSTIDQPPSRLKPVPHIGYLYLHFNSNDPKKPLVWIRQKRRGVEDWFQVAIGFSYPQDRRRQLGISAQGRPSWNKKPSKSEIHTIDEESEEGGAKQDSDDDEEEEDNT